MRYIYCICIEYIFVLILLEEHTSFDSIDIKRHPAEFRER